MVPASTRCATATSYGPHAPTEVCAQSNRVGSAYRDQLQASPCPAHHAATGWAQASFPGELAGAAPSQAVVPRNASRTAARGSGLIASYRTSGRDRAPEPFRARLVYDPVREGS